MLMRHTAMEIVGASLLCFIVTLNWTVTESQNLTSFQAPVVRIPDEQRLLVQLLHSYDPASRPVYNASHKVTVKFGFALTQISDMDEVNQVLTTNVWLEQEWNDERLRWDPADYNGLAMIRIPCEKLWLPDIVLYNSAEDYTRGYMQSRAMVMFDGTVFWPPPAKFRSSCKIDITYFPFDDQRCLMKFGSWTYDGFQVDLKQKSDRVDGRNYVPSGEWDLLGINITRYEVVYPIGPEPYPDVRFVICMRRKTLFYLFNIIFPCLWLTVLSLLSFWLPPDSGEKITLGITVLLAFSVFMLLIAESMPATSEFVPLIGIYLTVTMAMTSLSIVLTVFVLHIHHVSPHQRPVPQWMRTLIFKVIARLVCMRSSINTFTYTDDMFVREELHLNPLRETVFDGKEPVTNCNGNMNISNNINHNGYKPRNSYVAVEKPFTERLESVERNSCFDNISRHLHILIARQDHEDRHQEIVNEWRLVAHVIDRFLFWLFLTIAMVSTLFILVIRPLMGREAQQPCPKLDFG